MDWNRMHRLATQASTHGEPRKRGANDKGSADETGTWWAGASLALMSAAVAILAGGCSPQSDVLASSIVEKVYTVIPAALRVEAEPLVADIIRMKVTERVEANSGRITSPAKLSGRLFLENTSTNQPLRLISGEILYFDARGLAIPLENGRVDPSIRFASYSGETGRLNPSKVATELLYAEFPTDALRADRLKTIQVKLVFSSVSGGMDERKLNFAVSIDTP